MNEEILREFKIFREQVFKKFADYDNIIRVLISNNSKAIDEVVISMLEGGKKNV